MKQFIFFSIIALLWFKAEAIQSINDPSLLHKLDSLFKLNQKATYATVIGDSSPIYFCATYRTFEVPFSKIVNAFHDYKAVTNVIGVIRRFDKIMQGPTLSPKGTYDFEAKIGLARGWSLIDVDSVVVDTTGFYKLVFKGNDNPTLTSIYKDNHKGWFVIKNNHFKMSFTAQKTWDNKTRIGYVTWMTPEAYVPHWHYVLAAKFAIPGVLDDLESWLLKL